MARLLLSPFHSFSSSHFVPSLCFISSSRYPPLTHSQDKLLERKISNLVTPDHHTYTIPYFALTLPASHCHRIGQHSTAHYSASQHCNFDCLTDHTHLPYRIAPTLQHNMPHVTCCVCMLPSSCTALTHCVLYWVTWHQG
jgi:hypothetical protein